jgi:ERCC4-type nuclease
VNEILVDDRIGSKELLPELRKLSLPAKISRLEFGDFALTGNGPKGEVMVGIERKTVTDLLGSLASGRLSARQLPGMVQTYPYRWIFVEGVWREGRDKRIEIWREMWERRARNGNGYVSMGVWFPARTQLSWYEVQGRIANLEVKGACWVEKTRDMKETAQVIGVLYNWWRKPWSVHRGHLGLEKGLTPDRVLYSKPSYPRLFANIMPGVGWDKSKAVARHFKTIQRMVEATPREWRKVAGIGTKISEVIPMIIRGDSRVDRSRES